MPGGLERPVQVGSGLLSELPLVLVEDGLLGFPGMVGFFHAGRQGFIGLVFPLKGFVDSAPVVNFLAQDPSLVVEGGELLVLVHVEV